MALPVILGLLIGLVVGGACMALWAARRIGDEAARQFDRGFERGRWLADLSTTRALESLAGARGRRLITPGESSGPDPYDPPALLKPQQIRTAEPRTHAGPLPPTT